MFTLFFTSKCVRSTLIISILATVSSTKMISMDDDQASKALEKQIEGQLLTLRQELGKPSVTISNPTLLEKMLANPSDLEINPLIARLSDRPEHAHQNLALYLQQLALLQAKDDNAIGFTWNLTKALAHVSFASRIGTIFSLQERILQSEQEREKWQKVHADLSEEIEKLKKENDALESSLETYPERVASMAQKYKAEKAKRLTQTKELREQRVEQNRMAIQDLAIAKAELAQERQKAASVSPLRRENEILKKQMASMAEALKRTSFASVAKRAN